VEVSEISAKFFILDTHHRTSRVSHCSAIDLIPSCPESCYQGDYTVWRAHRVGFDDNIVGGARLQGPQELMKESTFRLHKIFTAISQLYVATDLTSV